MNRPKSRGSRYYNLLARIFREFLVVIIAHRRCPPFGVVVRIQKRRRIFSFDGKTGQPHFWLVSGSFLARFGSGLGSGSAIGSGLRVGLGLRPYLDRHQKDAIREQPTSVKILANVL